MIIINVLNNYMLIGGTAYAIVFDEIEKPFRAAKDAIKVLNYSLNSQKYDALIFDLSDFFSCFGIKLP